MSPRPARKRRPDRRFGEVGLSSVYSSKPAGFDGDDFLNLVARVECDLAPAEIVAELEQIHSLAGRRRDNGRVLSRTLDIDLLMYDQLVMDSPALRLPRADVLEYSFVLRPLAELAPDCRHPQTGRRLSEHWREFDPSRHPLRRCDVIL